MKDVKSTTQLREKQTLQNEPRQSHALRIIRTSAGTFREWGAEKDMNIST